MTQPALKNSELAPLNVKTPPRAPTPIPRAYPARSQPEPLAKPLLDPDDTPVRFDRTAFCSPKIDRPMFNVVTDEPTRPLPPPDRFAAAVVGQAIEVLLGHRPVRQLQTWLHPLVYEALARRAGLGQRIRGKAEKCLAPRVKQVIVCEPREGVAEASVVVFDGTKIRAAATRLEVRKSRWHVTALEII
ncbi:hypothetical protein J2S70_001280 [Trueperella bonasi]|uniref:Energy transducer TonB n=1 Tax=Trueperella bonasi TaxID=312286 RepID=A0ABT9NI45_9ACTO|nr:Rv3235 family protein [Trueperella bonasi]MDP9806698.1 hypothetical protein [Trueperella bonasi]